MVYDINSPSESTKVISLLMTWTGERHIHIHTILHQNKGDENARGHIGTELSNKAETVLQVEKDEKDPDISTVKAAPHYSTEKQTDDSTGERQEIHLQNRFSLLAVLYGNHFTLVPYHIYTEVK